jgi:hypothetical protein
MAPCPRAISSVSHGVSGHDPKIVIGRVAGAAVVDALPTVLGPSRTRHIRRGDPYPMPMAEEETDRPAHKPSKAASEAGGDDGGLLPESQYR